MLESFFVQKGGTKNICKLILAKISAICICVFSLKPVYSLPFHSREVSVHMYVRKYIWFISMYIYCSCVPQTLLSYHNTDPKLYGY